MFSQKVLIIQYWFLIHSQVLFRTPIKLAHILTKLYPLFNNFVKIYHKKCCVDIVIVSFQTWIAPPALHLALQLTGEHLNYLPLNTLLTQGR